MMILGQFLQLLQTKMPLPQVGGWFHIGWLIAGILGGVLLSRYAKTSVRTVLIVFSVINIVLEIYKQIVYTFSFNGEAFTADYQWYAFPFQLCSIPMYLGLIAAFTNGKVHRSLCCYFATYAVFSGLCVMVYPTDVLTDSLGVNIQTMMCHSSMITIGIYLIFSDYVKAEWKTLVRAFPVFCILVLIAMILNETAHLVGIVPTETFNMFFISPYCTPTLYVYKDVQSVVPYPWCIPLYIFAVSCVSATVLITFMILDYLRRLLCRKNAS